MSLFHPVSMFRLWELHKLLKTEARLQGQGLPIPSWLTAKIQALQTELAA